MAVRCDFLKVREPLEGTFLTYGEDVSDILLGQKRHCIGTPATYGGDKCDMVKGRFRHSKGTVPTYYGDIFDMKKGGFRGLAVEKWKEEPKNNDKNGIIVQKTTLPKNRKSAVAGMGTQMT